MSMCPTIRRHMYGYLDAELESRLVVVVREHLSRCVDCREIFSNEREFLTQCRAAGAERSHTNGAPAALLLQVRAKLARGSDAEPLEVSIADGSLESSGFTTTPAILSRVEST